MTYRELLQKGEECLSKAGITEASLDAFYLLEEVTGLHRSDFFLKEKEIPSAEEKNRYEKMILLREKRIPLQHILGKQEFMGLPFFVNQHVLIPRQETELLVEEGLKRLKPGMHLLDMCTGSGCILASLLWWGAKKYPLWWKTSPVTGLGVDISREALNVAQRNGKSLGVEMELLQSNLFAKVDGKESFDMILSNPPYIPTKEIEKLEEEVKFHDPLVALDGKDDGLFFYRHIIHQAPKYLKKDGYLLLEIGYDQGNQVAQLMEEENFADICVKRDLAGLDRIVIGIVQ